MQLTRGVITAILGMAASPAMAISFYIAPDVATDLGPTTYLPWNVVRKDNPGVYSLSLTLPLGTPVDGLHRMDSGDWLISVDAPTDLGFTTFDPRDVIRTNGLAFGNFFCGAAVGIPDGSDVDALFLRGGDAGALVISFDVPTTFGGITYDPSDLLGFNRIGPLCSDWAFAGLHLDSSTTVPPVPITSNLTGADFRAGVTVLSFDVPTTLGPATYMPGDLVSWNGVAFALFHSGSVNGWPVASIVNDFSLLADPGTVVPTVTVAPGPGFPLDLTISWTGSCSAGAENYGIYEGTIGTWYSHASIDCNDAGVPLTEVVPAAAGDHYYLVVPFNTNDEGSYGKNSAGFERPVGVGACRTPQTISPCP